MSRIQTLRSSPRKLVAAAATPETLVTSQLFVKSVVLQGLVTNTDFVYIGDATAQNFALAPGKSLEIHGDNLDNGTGAKLDLNTLFIKVNVNGEGVSFAYLDGI